MEPISLSLDDICQHVVSFGADIYPPVAILEEQTRLALFYEEARAQYGNLFDRIELSGTGFKISKDFRSQPGNAGPARWIDTFVLTDRGPVFVFPLVLPEPVGETGLEEQHLEQFERLRKLFFGYLPERKILRLGLVRELVFETGQSPCKEFISKQASFASADLAGGETTVKYRDEKCNVNLLIAPGVLAKATQLPVGQRVEQHVGYALRVRLDVNNRDVRPLDDADIQGILDRACSLWPEKLLEYLQERSSS